MGPLVDRCAGHHSFVVICDATHRLNLPDVKTLSDRV